MAIAIPAYQDYTIRAKVSEGMNVAGAAKLAVAETRQTAGSWPGTNTEAGLPGGASINGNNVASVHVGTDGSATAGQIVITYNNDPAIDTNTLILSPSFTGGSVAWTCTQGDVAPKY